MCYTYDSLNRVTARTIKKLSDNSVISTESFTYDAAGNIVGASENTAFVYDTNNRLTSYNGNSVSYDMDGNMLSNGTLSCTYDSANRLISAGGHTYTYNAEDVRIRNLCSDADTTYLYDINCKLSKLLCKTTNGITTKYVYGRGLIGEQKEYCYKIYHFDCRGSTVAITEIDGLVTDTFEYDTYGKCISHVGPSFVIFGYNGRDGVVTDKNGLIYMRARYYSPEMKRFINADIIPGKLSNAITLNRFAYANGNPVSFVDPFGLSADNKNKLASENTENHIQINYVVYFVIYKYGPGLPIVGHTKIYFIDTDNNIYVTEFSGQFPDKGSADIRFSSKDDVEDEFREDTMRAILSSLSPTKYINGADMVVLEGDFTKSYHLAKDYGEDKLDYPDYHLINNSCLTYTNMLLDSADIDDPFVSHYLQNDYTVVPRDHITDLKLAANMSNRFATNNNFALTNFSL